MEYIYPILAVLVVSLVSLLGIVMAFIRNPFFLKELNLLLISLAVGSLLGGAFLHLLPDVFVEDYVFAPVFVLGGIFVFFLIEKILHFTHEHNPHSISKEKVEMYCNSCDEKIEFTNKSKPLGTMVLISDSLHNFLDGILIGIAFLTSPLSGIATTFSMLVHEVPQEISNFGVLIHSGYSIKKALFYNFLSALVAFAGLFSVFLFGSVIEKSLPYATAFAAGSLIYIAMADLIPELHKQRKKINIILQSLFIVIGVMFMYLLTLLE